MGNFSSANHYYLTQYLGKFNTPFLKCHFQPEIQHMLYSIEFVQNIEAQFSSKLNIDNLEELQIRSGNW